MRRLRHNVTPSLATLLAAALLTTAAFAQAPLPANYQTILDNRDVLVMRVHYGPHEFVPMHDHSAYPTVFVYLNNSGEVRIDHAPPTSFSVTRPPTHTGAFRIAPGMIERHSITNLSDLPSDFLRVELKSIPPHAIKQVFRGNAATPPFISGVTVVFKDSAIRIDRILCELPEPCHIDQISQPSLLVMIRPWKTVGENGPPINPVEWLPAGTGSGVGNNPKTTEPYEALRIVFLAK